jgi:hypothetical protein
LDFDEALDVVVGFGQVSEEVQAGGGGFVDGEVVQFGLQDVGADYLAAFCVWQGVEEAVVLQV